MTVRSRHITPNNRIALVGTCRSGLGHMRRLVSVAAKIKLAQPDAKLVLMTNASPSGIPSGEMAVFSKVMIRERCDMGHALSEGAFDLALLDTIRLPGIAAFQGAAVLILRETPDDRLDGFRREDGQPWHRVIVPNPAHHWRPRIGSDFARSVDPVGWILRPTGVRLPGESAGIVVASGGGGNEETRKLLYPLLDEIISQARKRTLRPFRVRQALGPRAAGVSLAEANKVFDPGGDLNAVFRAADLVISTAGYNSVLELASTDTPTLLAAIPRSIDDQAARVREWGSRLGHGLDPARLEDAALWLADQIDRPRRRPPVNLGPDGATRAAELIVDMLCPTS